MKDFFVSYNKANCQWAEWIAWQLEEAGYTTVLQAWDFRPSSNFVLNMQEAASEAERTIAVLSPDYLKSDFPQPEWASAFAKDPTGEKGLLVPIRVQDCDPKGLLPQIVYIDLVGLDEDAAKEELLKGISRERAKPSTPPPFPQTSQHTVLKPHRFPGALPPVWNVPHNRNINFTGRQEILANLRTALLTNESVSLVQAIHGLGGIGKTQIAVEYAYLYFPEYDIVWWIGAEEETNLVADFSILARELELPQHDAQDQRVIIEAVRKWLGQHKRWLLIFDNVTKPEAVRDFLPQGKDGHVIITSRNPNWKGIGNTIQVRVLEPQEAISFLRKRTGQNDAQCSELAEELGYLPLALEQAGAYIEETGKTVAEYLGLFRKHQIELLSRGNISTNYPATVRTTWEISFQQAASELPIVTLVLALLGFLAPDNIPQTLLNKIVEISTSPEDKNEFSQLNINDAIAALRRYSLIDITNGELSIHRLVQAISRDYLKHIAEYQAAGVVGIVNAVFPLESDDIRTWNDCAALLPHAFAAMAYAETLNQVFYPMSELLNKIGTYFIARAEYQAAQQALEHGLQIVKTIYGEDSIPVADISSNLGLVYYYLGDDSKALMHLNKALAINKKENDEDTISVANLLNSFGLILSAAGDIEGAHVNYVRANEIAESVYGKDDPRVAITLDNIGCMLIELGDIDGALSYFKRALSIDEEYYGTDTPQAAVHLSHIANVYAVKGKLSKALAKSKRVLQIRESSYDPNHPLVAIARLNLAVVLRALNNIREARNQVTQAFEVLKERLGDDAPETIRAERILNELSDSPSE